MQSTVASTGAKDLRVLAFLEHRPPLFIVQLDTRLALGVVDHHSH